MYRCHVGEGMAFSESEAEAWYLKCIAASSARGQRLSAWGSSNAGLSSEDWSSCTGGE